MKPEQRFQRDVVAALRSLDARPVSNALDVGMPDVNYNGGWIELKVCPGGLTEWAEKNKAFDIPLYTPQQRAWALRRHARGGNVWLLFKYGRECFLIPGQFAARFMGQRSLHEWRQGVGTSHWKTFADMKRDLACVLSSRTVT